MKLAFDLVGYRDLSYKVNIFGDPHGIMKLMKFIILIAIYSYNATTVNRDL